MRELSEKYLKLTIASVKLGEITLPKTQPKL